MTQEIGLILKEDLCTIASKSAPRLQTRNTAPAKQNLIQNDPNHTLANRYKVVNPSTFSDAKLISKVPHQPTRIQESKAARLCTASAPVNGGERHFKREWFRTKKTHDEEDESTMMCNPGNFQALQDTALVTNDAAHSKLCQLQARFRSTLGPPTSKRPKTQHEEVTPERSLPFVAKLASPFPPSSNHPQVIAKNPRQRLKSVLVRQDELRQLRNEKLQIPRPASARAAIGAFEKVSISPRALMNCSKGNKVASVQVLSGAPLSAEQEMKGKWKVFRWIDRIN